MSYLNDYLKVIPKADAERIRENILSNREIFEIQNLSEDEFSYLIHQLAESEITKTKTTDLGTKIIADPLNEFYSNVAIDLNHLFPEQNSIEEATEHYDEIYRAHLEDISRGIEALSQRMQELEQKTKNENNLVIRSFGFEPEKQGQLMETKNSENNYLFIDRDGSELNLAIIERNYHTYYLSLEKETDIDALRNEKGITTATLEVLYQSPGTLSNNSNMYQPNKALDQNNSTFWFNTALKENNQKDSISISPKGRE